MYSTIYKFWRAIRDSCWKKNWRVFTSCWQHTLKNKILKADKRSAAFFNWWHELWKPCSLTQPFKLIYSLWIWEIYECHWHAIPVAKIMELILAPTFLPLLVWLAFLNNSCSNWAFSCGKLEEIHKCVPWLTKSQQMLEEITLNTTLWCEISFASWASKAKTFLTTKAFASPLVDHIFSMVILCLSECDFTNSVYQEGN